MPNTKTLTQVVPASVDEASVRFETAVAFKRFPSRGETFPHYLLAPIHYEPNYAYPLLVWLHDADRTEAELFEVAPKISARNYVSIAPRGVERRSVRLVCERRNGRVVETKRVEEKRCDWPETEDGVAKAENLVFDSIDQAIAKFNVARNRVFLLGRGSGGTMALRVGLRHPREFAGVVSIDGAFPTLDNAPLRNWREIRDLPILMTTAGARSTNVPRLTPDQLRLFHTAGMTVVIRQYNEDSENADRSLRTKKILEDVNRWTMERIAGVRGAAVRSTERV